MAKIYGDEKGAKYQWEKLKGQPLSVKLKYIMEYYGLGIVVVIAAIAMIVSITSSIIYNSVPNVISGEVYSGNLEEDQTEQLRIELCSAMGYDEKDYHISIGASYASSDDLQDLYQLSQKFQAEIAAHSLDFLAAPKESLLNYFPASDKDSRAFYDLREVLPDDLMKKLENDNRILYGDTDEAGKVPVAVYLNGTNVGSMLGLVDSIDSYAACVITAPNKDAYIAMIQLIYH